MKASEKLYFLLFAAAFLFPPLFYYGVSGPLDFWTWMSVNICLMILSARICGFNLPGDFLSDLRPGFLFKASAGVLSALALYAVFSAGNYLSAAILPFAREGIESVYLFKEGQSVYKITLLIVFVIGPGEELIWRGLFQKQLGEKYGALPGLAAATLIYGSVHILSFNPMLVLAAFVCGLFWGLLYVKYNSIVINVISHVAWDLLVFLIFPFNM